MRSRIVSRTSQQLIITLNKCDTVFLALGETSPPVEDAEISGTAKVDKLLASNSIALALHAPCPRIRLDPK